MLVRRLLVDQILKEIYILSQIRHPNITEFRGCFEDENNIYLLLELADGESLYARLKSINRFEEKQAASLIYKIFEAVHYLQGLEDAVLHRDIKPENIMFVGNEVKLTDFGCCTSDQFDKKSLCGTRDYLSPEMVQGKDYNYKIDNWALGVLLFEMVTGQTAFHPGKKIGKTKEELENELKKNILEKQPSFPSFLSIELQNLISDLLEKDVEERLEIGDALRHDWFVKMRIITPGQKQSIIKRLEDISKKEIDNQKRISLISPTKEMDSIFQKQMDYQFNTPENTNNMMKKSQNSVTSASQKYLDSLKPIEKLSGPLANTSKVTNHRKNQSQDMSSWAQDFNRLGKESLKSNKKKSLENSSYYDFADTKIEMSSSMNGSNIGSLTVS